MPVAGLITGRLPVTLWLLCYAAVLAVLSSASRWPCSRPPQDGVRDHVVRAVPLLGLGHAAFWVGLSC